jgi:hypothetical protein
MTGGGGRRKGFGTMAFRGGDRAPMDEEGVDGVLQLDEGAWEVRRGPKGADEGSTGELTEGERYGGAAAAVWSTITDTRPRREEGVTGCLGVLAREDEREMKKGGAAVMGRPF